LGNAANLEKLSDAVIRGEGEAAKAAALETINAGYSAYDAVSKGLMKGMGIVGVRFGRGECFLPEVLLAGEAFTSAIEILKPHLKAGEVTTVGKATIGTVEGDIHDLGKNLVALLLATAGFEVFDLGKNVKASAFVDKAEEVKADMILLSAIMTTTMPVQEEVIQLLKDMGIRDKYKVLVGGGPVTADWSEKIGADGYANDAVEGVKLAKRLLES